MYWRGYLSEVRCKWFAYGSGDVTAIPSFLASFNPAWKSYGCKQRSEGWHHSPWSKHQQYEICRRHRPNLWCCWFGDRKGIRPVKTEWWDAGVAICLGRDADLHVLSWCHCHSLSLASVNPDWFYLSSTSSIQCTSCKKWVHRKCVCTSSLG